MPAGEASGLSGLLSIFVPYERRKIVIGAGLQYHESELTYEPSDFQYLESRIGADFRVSADRKRANYVNRHQRRTPKMSRRHQPCSADWGTSP